MFTGIVQGTAVIKNLDLKEGVLTYALQMDEKLLTGLQTGASVSVDGCCQTLVRIEDSLAYFQAIPETLRLTHLSSYTLGQIVNIERSARFGDEIGGHILSGHILGTAKLHSLDRSLPGQLTFQLQCPQEWMAYIFPKGYIALDGASLTVGDVLPDGFFKVHLIPETLMRTTFSNKKEGSLFNVEIDSDTFRIVQTVQRMLKQT